MAKKCVKGWKNMFWLIDITIDLKKNPLIGKIILIDRYLSYQWQPYFSDLDIYAFKYTQLTYQWTNMFFFWSYKRGYMFDNYVLWKNISTFLWTFKSLGILNGVKYLKIRDLKIEEATSCVSAGSQKNRSFSPSKNLIHKAK